VSNRWLHEEIRDRIRVQEIQRVEMRRIAYEGREVQTKGNSGRRSDLFVVGSVRLYLYQGL
jgi:hypothetical protein